MRLSLTLPSSSQTDDLLKEESSAASSYQQVGATKGKEKITGFDNDYQRVKIGHGRQDFERAKQGLRDWTHFPETWTDILPKKTPILPGQTLLMYFRLFGFCWQNGCRIVYVIDETDRFGFAYGTLPSHIEYGEELFAVEIDQNGDVWYELKAFSRPRLWAIKSGYPLARLLQEKFRQDSAAAMRQQVSGTPEFSFTPNRWAVHFISFFASAWLLWPGSWMGHHYGLLPLAFALWMMTPWVLSFAGDLLPAVKRHTAPLLKWHWVGAALATVSMLTEPGWLSALLATPWLAGGLWVSLAGWRDFSLKQIGLSQISVRFGCLFLLVGVIWFWADRADIRLLGFGEDIVRLTALHFHFAGFALPVLAGLMLAHFPTNLLRIAAVGVMAGIPLTAIGITTTHLGMGPYIETAASVTMSLSALLVALALLHASWSFKSIFMALSGLVLLFTMSLALGYGLRVITPEWALSLDYMRAIHGSLNGLVALPLAFYAIWYIRKH
ncbi:MAG: YndJ family transporter [Saprospiraceae bacterium]|nr:YndJ family transporter [Saprospiraceae bacterium]